jgi:hypothetical protein
MSKHAENTKLVRKLLQIISSVPDDMSYEEAWDEASLSFAKGRCLLPLSVHPGFFDPDRLPLDFDYETGCNSVQEGLIALLPALQSKEVLDIPEVQFEEVLAGKILRITVHVDAPLTPQEVGYLEYNLKRLPTGKVRYYCEGEYDILIDSDSE